MFASPTVAPPNGTTRDSAGAPKRFVAPYLAPAIASQPSKHVGDLNRGSVGGAARSGATFTSSTVSGELMASRADAHDRDDGAYPTVTTFMTHIVPPRNAPDGPLTIAKGTPIYVLPLTTAAATTKSAGDVLDRGGSYRSTGGTLVELPPSPVAARSREPHQSMHVGFIGGYNPKINSAYTYEHAAFPRTRRDADRLVIGNPIQPWPRDADRDMLEALPAGGDVRDRIVRRGYLAFVAEHTVAQFKPGPGISSASTPVPVAVTVEHMSEVLMANDRNITPAPLAGERVVAGLEFTAADNSFAVKAKTMRAAPAAGAGGAPHLVKLRAGVHLVPPVHHKEGGMLSCRVALSAIPCSNLIYSVVN